MTAREAWARSLERRLGSPAARLRRRLRYPGLPWRLDARVPVVRLGSDYGGFVVHAAALRPDSVVYSFGVGEDASFDLALLERFAPELHAFDPTPRAVAWVGERQWPPGFHFHPVGVAARDGDRHFYPPEDPSFVSHSLLAQPGATRPPLELPVRRVSTLARERGHERLALLKLDVEGAEYEVIEDLLDAGPPVDQIAVEFHHHLPGVAVARTRAAIAALRGRGYAVVAIAPSLSEWSFVHRAVLEG